MPDRGDQARGTRLRAGREAGRGALASRATFNRTGKAPGGLPATTTTLTPLPKRSPRPEASEPAESEWGESSRCR